MAQKWAKKWHFIGGALQRQNPRWFGPLKRPKKGLFLGSKNGPPPKFFGRGGCGNAKNAKIGVGKMRKNSIFCVFWPKNGVFWVFGPFFDPFLDPPKRGSKKGQKMTPKTGDHFLSFLRLFFYLQFFLTKKKNLQTKKKSKNFFSKNFFQKRKHFFTTK